MNEYKLNEQVFTTVLNYISNRPLSEVYGLFQALVKIKKEQDEINKMSQEMKPKEG